MGRRKITMKLARQCLILPSIVCAVVSGFSYGQKPLAELYKTGKVRFVQEIVLDEKTMPKDVLFVGPVDIACDPAGNVYVMDFSDNNIKKFDPSGKFLKVIGRKGQGPGEFNMPVDMAFAKDRLVVWDMGNRRLCALTLTGELIKAQNESAFSGRPNRVRALPSGEIVLETEKTYRGEADRPQDRFLEILTPDLQSKMTIYSQAVLRNKYMRTQSGTFNVPQPFCPDVYWDVSPCGNIIVGFSGKYEISIYSSEGEKVSTFSHSYDPVKVTEEDEKSFFDGMSYTTGTGVQRGAPDHIVKNTTFPRFKPAYSALVVDSEGNILIHTYGEKKDETYRYFDAFDALGKFIARVRVEGETLFPVYGQRAKVIDGSLWLTKYGSDELPKVIKYRISE
jgi:hypothetical protein